MTADFSNTSPQTAPNQNVNEKEPWQFEKDVELQTLVKMLVDERIAAQPTRENKNIEQHPLSQTSLQDSNEALRVKLENEWDKPRRVFTYITIGASVFFGINLFQQLFAIINFNSQMDALRDQSKEVDGQIARFKSFESDYHAYVERDQTRRASSMKILALLDVARDQLIHQKNYDRALHYADEARDELESLKSIPEPKASEGEYRSAGELARMCSQLDGAISLIHAESYFQRGKPQDLNLLRAAASRVVDSGCGCLEGHYYLGLCNLLESEQLRGGDAETAERTAVEELQKAVGAEGRSSLASVFLGAVQLELGNLDVAIANADNFLEDFPASFEGRRRLSSDTQARIWAASIVKELASFVRSPTKIVDDSGCSVDVGAMGPMESALLERLFLRLVRRKNILFKDGRQSDLFGYACLRSAVLLRSVSCGMSASCPGGHCSPPDDFVSPLMLKEYSVIPRVDLPPISSDLRLGVAQENGDTLMMLVQIVMDEEQVRIVDENDVETSFSYKAEKAIVVTVTIKAGNTAPPGHYIKYQQTAPVAAPPADPA